MTRSTMEGWMVRYGRRKIGRAFFHKRYFVLESLVLAYYKRQPSAKEVPLKTLPIDGNCRVDDRGLETHHGHTVYVLSVYNKKDRSHRITMAAFNVQDACAWKEALEHAIDQEDQDRDASSSDHDSQGNSGKSQADDDDDKPQHHHRHRTVGNGPPESIQDWSRGVDPRWGNLDVDAAVSARRHWHLVRCQNGLRFFEEVQDDDQIAQSRWKAMKAVGVVDASCAEIFELIMGIDETRYEWDCSFQEARLVQEVDGHTTILYQRLQLDFLPMFLWPRDLCYLRYWRRNDDGSYVAKKVMNRSKHRLISGCLRQGGDSPKSKLLFQTAALKYETRVGVSFKPQEHSSCPPQPGCVRAHLENGGFTIFPLKPRANGENRARVQQLVHIDLKGWGANYVPLCHHHSVTQMLNSVAGLREWFAQKDCVYSQSLVPRIAKLGTAELSKRSAPKKVASLPDMHSAGQSTYDESEFEDEDVQYFTDSEAYLGSESIGAGDGVVEPPPEELDLSMLSGNLSRGDHENGKNCWSIPASCNFRVRSKRFLIDRSKTAAGEPLMQLVAVDWLKDIKRIDHVAKRKGCVAQVAAEKGLFTVAFNVQVPAASHYSMIFYFVAPKAPKGSLLQRFVDGDDNFRNSRLKLIPSVPKGSWIVRQSVGTTPCILGKAVDITYHRSPKYLEVDVDIGSSTVANGVLGLVFGVVSALVVDMAFLIQGNGMDELPERLIGAVRVSHLSLASAISPAPEAD